MVFGLILYLFCFRWVAFACFKMNNFFFKQGNLFYALCFVWLKLWMLKICTFKAWKSFCRIIPLKSHLIKLNWLTVLAANCAGTGLSLGKYRILNHKSGVFLNLYCVHILPAVCRGTAARHSRPSPDTIQSGHDRYQLSSGTTPRSRRNPTHR